MEPRQLGKSGLRVSALSLGAMTFGESTTFMKGVTSPDEEARRVFDAAVDAGMNLVDTANVYSEGRSEELTGEWKDSYKAIDSERNWKILDAVTAVAKRRDATPAAVSLAGLLARPEVSSVIVGARNVTQLKDNLAALEVRLASDDIRELDEASKLDWGYPYNFIGLREPW